MTLLDYGSANWGEGSSWWLVVGQNIAFDKDIFTVEIDKSVWSCFCIRTQIGGDCLFEIIFGIGKFSGEIRFWGDSE